MRPTLARCVATPAGLLLCHPCFQKEKPPPWLAGGGLATQDSEHSVCYAQFGIGRHYIDMVGLNGRSLADFGYRQLGGFRKQFRKYAFVLGLQVLHQDKSHPRVQRQSGEKFREGVQPAGRCSNTYDRESPFSRLKGAFPTDWRVRRNSTASCRPTRSCGWPFRRFWRSSFHRISPRVDAERRRIPTLQRLSQRLSRLQCKLARREAAFRFTKPRPSRLPLQVGEGPATKRDAAGEDVRLRPAVGAGRSACSYSQ